MNLFGFDSCFALAALVRVLEMVVLTEVFCTPLYKQGSLDLRLFFAIDDGSSSIFLPFL